MLHHISTPAISIKPIHKARHFHKKKRVSKACYACRIKKTKCDGIKPCAKCVQENKICTFSENNKQRDKSYPDGYVELLETRLDLLTKGIEKVILMSRPYLKFLELLIRDDQSIPINDVISYLINEEGLIKGLPIEWDDGATIAANLITDDNDSICKASKSFAEFKLKRKEDIRKQELEERKRIIKDNGLSEGDKRSSNNNSTSTNNNEKANRRQTLYSPVPTPFHDTSKTFSISSMKQKTTKQNDGEVEIELSNLPSDELIRLDMIESNYYTTTPISNIEYGLNSDLIRFQQNSDVFENFDQFSTTPLKNIRTDDTNIIELNCSDSEYIDNSGSLFQ